ncbi:MAG: hypothetical protein ACO3Z6_01850 [Pseudomonadales bacterium]
MKSPCESPGADAKERETSSTVVTPENRVLVGDALAAIGREIGLTNEDFAVLESVVDETPVEPFSVD